MKRICLIGAVDKRIISYPLIKTLMFLGKTLIVTDDGIYRRFDENFDTHFNFGNSDFIIEPKINEQVIEDVEKLSSQYEFILYITTNELPPNCDKVIYCKGVNRAILGDEVIEALENIEFKEVYITFSKLEDKELLKIEPNKTVLTYIYSCEDMKEFLDIKDPSISNLLFTFFENELGIPKTTIKGLLQRKG